MDTKMCAIFDLGYFRNAVMGTIIESMYRAGYKYKDAVEVTYHAMDVLDELKTSYAKNTKRAITNKKRAYEVPTDTS